MGRRRVPAVLAVLLLTLMSLAGPGQRPAAALGPIEDLGTPVTDYSVLDVEIGTDALGNPRLYGSTYAIGASPGVVFFGVDPATGTVTTQKSMAGSYGGYHVARRASDGSIFLPTISSDQIGRLWRYDPATDAVSVAAYQQEPAYSFFFGITATSWNSMYVGGYPSGHLNEFTTAGNLVDQGLVSSGSTYPKGIAEVSSSPKTVLVGGGTPAKVTVVNLDTGVRTEVLPPAYAGYSFAYNASRAGSDILVQLVTPDTRILRYTTGAGTATFAAELAGLTNTWTLPITGSQVYGQGSCGGSSGLIRYDLVTQTCTFQVAGGQWLGGRMHYVTVGGQQWIASVGAKGMFGRWNPATGQLVTNQLSLPGHPTAITALAQGPDGKLYGGTYETNALFRYDTATTVLGKVPGGGGEILSMASANGKLFIGAYTGAAMNVYDPALPWNPGSSAGSNPRFTGAIGTQQGRPWDMTVGSDGRIWTATGAEYGQLSGAFTATGTTSPFASESWRGDFGDHNIFSIASGGGKIFVGTTKHGDGVNATGYEQFGVWDIATETLQFSAAIDFVSDYFYALCYAANGILYGSTDSGQLFRYDPATNTILSSVSFPYGAVLGMINGPDGKVYGHTASTVFSIDPATNTTTVLATTPTSYYRTLAFDANGYLYWADGARLMRMDVL